MNNEVFHFVHTLLETSEFKVSNEISDEQSLCHHLYARQESRGRRRSDIPNGDLRLSVPHLGESMGHRINRRSLGIFFLINFWFRDSVCCRYEMSHAVSNL